MKNLLVTGYRAHELGIFDNRNKAIPYIKKAIRAKLIPLLEEGLEWVITPGQFGVDLWAADTALELKEDYPELRVAVITAHLNQEEKWKEERQNEYRQLLSRLDYYGAVSKRPYEGSWQFQARDDLLLRKTEGILLFYDEENGPASPRFILERARKLQENGQYGLLRITPDDVQAIADEEQLYE